MKRRAVAAGILVVAAMALAACSPGTAAPRPSHSKGPLVTSVVPLPVSQKTDASAAPFSLTETSIVRATSDDTAATSRVAVQLLGTATGLKVKAGSGEAGAHDVVLKIVPGGAAESYTLRAGADGATVTGADEAGLFYGVQTLVQLLHERDGAWQAAATEIADHPRFAYRGAMLDVARHFFPVEVVKLYIDRASSLKLNYLHLHLTDDQGWRIQIDSRPKLAELSSTTSMSGDAGGFYTKADYEDIVAYAASRHMTVVPEIDLPGHTHAISLAYPEIAEPPVVLPEIVEWNQEIPVAGKPYTGFGVGFSSLKIHDEATYAFVEDVVREVAAMTPGPYIHIGGDEPHAIASADYQEFMSRVTKIVEASGKTPIAWHEAGASPDLAPGTIGQYWNYLRPEGDNAAKTLAFARNGGKVIMSPADVAYLDMKYDDTTTLGLTWAHGTTSVRESYAWDPADIVEGLPADALYGVEAPLWSETLRSLADIDYMAFPRIASAAEIAWSPKDGADRQWDSFSARVAQLGPLWTREGIRYYASAEILWAEK